jgi:radical SAM superfamily enzyme YgiQ (UPF0313 family)
MKITLVNPFEYFGLNRFLNRFFPVTGLTLPYISSLISEISDRYEVKIIDEARERIDFNERPDLVAISTLTVRANRAYRIADEFRKRGVKVVLGGPHVSAVPEEAMAHCDTVAIGNAETVLPAILHDFERGELKPVYHNYVPTSLPSKRKIISKNKEITSILASRGCEMNCSFCTMQNVFGKFYLHRDINCVIEEIRSVTTKEIFFVDDNFYGSSPKSRGYYSSLLSELEGKDIGWVAQCRLSAIKDDETLKLFKRTNCAGLLLGFESLNSKNKTDVGKQKIDKKEYLKLIEKIHSYGIGIIGSFIFGFDEDTPETIEETLAFCLESKIEMALFTVLTPFPGTALFKRLTEEGRIISTNWDEYTMHKCVFKPKHFSPRELEESVINATKKFYSLTSILKRTQFNMNYSFLGKYFPVNLLRNIALKF